MGALGAGPLDPGAPIPSPSSTWRERQEGCFYRQPFTVSPGLLPASGSGSERWVIPAAVGQLDLPGFPSGASLLWGTPHAHQAGCATQQGTLTSPWCQTSSASPTSVSLAVNERGVFLLLLLFCFLHGLFLFTERGRRKQLITVLWQRRLVLRSPRCLPGSRGAPWHPKTQGLNLSSWLPDEADASPSRCWEEVTGPILSPWGSSG